MGIFDSSGDCLMIHMVIDLQKSLVFQSFAEALNYLLQVEAETQSDVFLLAFLVPVSSIFLLLAIPFDILQLHSVPR